MKSPKQASPVRGRLLVLFYLFCSVLLLTPTMAPPERGKVVPKSEGQDLGGFRKGQPEVFQTMDNMLRGQRSIKKEFQLPNEESGGYPALLTHKTSYLLSEAENMLNRVKNLKERRWVKAFIHRLRLLASVLDQSGFGNDPNILEQNFTFGDTAPSVSVYSPEEDHILPTPLVLQESTIHETDQKQQDDKVTTRSPELTKPDYPVEQKVVTEPEMLQTMPITELTESDDDELVKELEELHKMFSVENQQQNITPHDADPTTAEPSTTLEEFSSEAPSKRMAKMIDNEIAIEREKIRLKQNLAREVHALERLGEPEEEILNSLHLNNHEFHVSMHPKMFRQRVNAENVDHVGTGNSFRNLQDVNTDDTMISNINPSIWRPIAVRPVYNPYRQVYMNSSFHGKNINLDPVHQQVLARKYQTHMANNPLSTNLQIYQDGIKNTIQKLKKQHQDFLLKNQVPQMQQEPQQNSPNPMPNRPNNKYQVNPYLVDHHMYKPYPYFYNPQNLTAAGSESTDKSFISNSIADHNFGNNLSDEMKRQLRDGKVILLSDSVVRSNIDSATEREKSEISKEAEKKKEKMGDKNDTQAPK